MQFPRDRNGRPLAAGNPAGDERELVRNILAGDARAFEQFVGRYQNLVSHIIFRMVSHRQDREELCQEVFMKAYQHLGKFRFHARLSTWIGRIAYHAAINHLHKMKVPLFDDEAAGSVRAAEARDRRNTLAQVSEGCFGAHPTPETLAERAEMQALVQAEIERLPPVARTILTLFHHDQLRIREIAEIMRMPAGTVKSHLFRAREKLKNRLLSIYHHEANLL